MSICTLDAQSILNRRTGEPIDGLCQLGRRGSRARAVRHTLPWPGICLDPLVWDTHTSAESGSAHSGSENLASLHSSRMDSRKVCVCWSIYSRVDRDLCVSSALLALSLRALPHVETNTTVRACEVLDTPHSRFSLERQCICKLISSTLEALSPKVCSTNDRERAGR